MKKILTTILLFLVAICINAQKTFEGEIAYNNFENYSKMFIKMNKGIIFNGPSEHSIIVKGNVIVEKNNAMHLICYYLTDENHIVMYSDILKRGIRIPYDYVAELQSTLSKESTVKGVKRNYNITLQSGQKKHHGVNCKIYAGTIVDDADVGTPTTYNFEAWVSDKYIMPEGYKILNNMFDSPGLVMKSTYQCSGKLPLLGKMENYIYSYIKSITPRTVSDAEVTVPADWVIQDGGQKQWKQFYKDLVKALKEKNIYPGDLPPDAKTNYKLDEEWDF